MCDVMPTITEDNIGQRHQFSGEDVRINEFMDTVVEERNKLLDTLSKSQIRLDETEKQLAEVESERNALQRQIDATFPKVSLIYVNILYLLYNIISSSLFVSNTFFINLLCIVNLKTNLFVLDHYFQDVKRILSLNQKYFVKLLIIAYVIVKFNLKILIYITLHYNIENMSTKHHTFLPINYQ